MKPETREKALRIALVAVGAVFLFGLLPLTLLLPDSWMWMPRQPEYEQMILTIYAVLGIYLLRAARNPAAHASIIAFTAWSSLAHGGVMAFQALADPMEHANFCGDIPALIAVGLVFVWLGPQKV
jgi:hypothetical protein